MENEYIYKLKPEHEEFYNGGWRDDFEEMLEQSDIDPIRRCFITGNTVAGREIIKMFKYNEPGIITILMDGEGVYIQMNNGNLVIDNHDEEPIIFNTIDDMYLIFENINGNDPMRVIDKVSITYHGKTFEKYVKPPNCSWKIAKQKVLPIARQNILKKKTVKKYLLPRLLQKRNKRMVTEELKLLPPMGIFPGGSEYQKARERFYSPNKFGNCNCNWINKSIRYLLTL
jgi:hypothetical protein